MWNCLANRDIREPHSGISASWDAISIFSSQQPTHGNSLANIMMEDMYFYSLNLTTTFLCLKKNQLVFFSFCVKPQYLARNNNTTSTKALVWQTPLRICLMSWPKYSSSPILSSSTLLTLHQHMLYGLWQCPFPLAPPRIFVNGGRFH